MVQAAIVMGGLFTAGSALTSCEEFKSPKQQGRELVLKRNPSADTVYASAYRNLEVKDEYAERYTDSTKIKLIREKYKFRLTQYQQALDSLKEMQQKVDSMLLTAAKAGDLEGIKTALANGADVNAQGDKSGNTALINVIEYCHDTPTAFEAVKYLLGEPSIRTKIENKKSINAVDLVKAKLNGGEVEWETILRKFNEPTTDNSRSHGSSELDKLAKQVEQTYAQLMETYGKEMKAALGYTYIGKNVHQNENGEQMYIVGGYGDSYPMGIEVTTNEDGSKDTAAVNPYAVHPTMPAKLLLKKPKQKYLTPEEIGQEIVYKSRRVSNGRRRYRKYRTVTDAYIVTTTRDGAQHVQKANRGR